jgi:hypothetical protein
MDKKILNIIHMTALGLVGLTIIGYFFPASLFWGFHFLGFLPFPVFVLYLALVVALYILYTRGKLEPLFRRGAKFMDREPELFLAATGFIFILFAFIFQIRASLLGDSFTLIFNFRDYADGISYLAPWHEPLSIYVLYYAVTLLGSLAYPQIFTSFFIVDIVFGLLFIVLTFYIVKNLFSSAIQRFLVFSFLIVLPYMEFFFGYVEVYSVSTVLLALFVLCSVLVIQRKLPFYVVPIVWLLLTFSHYINGLFGLAVLFLAYQSYERKEIRSIVIGFGSVVLLLVLVFVAAKFDTERLINVSPVSHFLSFVDNISPINAYSQAYSFFSFYHFLDVVNYLIMMAPMAVVIMIVWATYFKEETFLQPTINLWLTIAVAPIFTYYLFSKLEQGNASDWDAFAGQFFIVALFAAVLFFQKELHDGTKIFALIVSVSLLQSLPWFAVNMPAEPSIQRFQSLWDKHILSQLGNYTHALRLTRYYESQNDTLREIDVWDKYSKLYPSDPRGYINEVQTLDVFAHDDYERKAATYERWLRAAPQDDTLRLAYAAMCINGGNKYFHEQKYDIAKLFYFKAIIADDSSALAYNNIGSVYAQEGKLDTAAVLFGKAIALDSTYAEAYYNNGNVYIDQGKRQAGFAMIQRAARLGNLQAIEYLKRNK